MVALPKIIGGISCGLVLCLSLSNVTQARDRMGPDPCAERRGSQPNHGKCDAETRQGIRTITGEVLHIKGANLLVKQSDGEKVTLHIDLTTQTGIHIVPGIRIEAKVNEVEGEKYALSISSAQ